MKVRLKTAVAGPTEAETFAQGDVADLDPAYAKRLLDSDQAEAVAKKPVERAEKADKPTTARKRTPKKG